MNLDQILSLALVICNGLVLLLVHQNNKAFNRSYEIWKRNQQIMTDEFLMIRRTINAIKSDSDNA
jgi:hypothetical protein